MAKLTLAFAVALIMLGTAVFFATGSNAPTALIPAYFGIVLGILGLLANTDKVNRRMLFMHIAVTIALLGVLFPGWRAAGDLVHMAQHQPVLRPAAMEEELAMAIICLVYVVLCIRSFIAARRTRT